MIAPAVAELEAHMATTAACAVWGRSRATQCRRRRPEPLGRGHRAAPGTSPSARRRRGAEVSRSCTRTGSWTSPRPRCGRPCSTRAATLAHQPRCGHRPWHRRAPPPGRPPSDQGAPNDIWTFTGLRGPAKPCLYGPARYVPGWMQTASTRPSPATTPRPQGADDPFRPRRPRRETSRSTARHPGDHQSVTRPRTPNETSQGSSATPASIRRPFREAARGRALMRAEAAGWSTRAACVRLERPRGRVALGESHRTRTGGRGIRGPKRQASNNRNLSHQG